MEQSKNVQQKFPFNNTGKQQPASHNMIVYEITLINILWT